MINTTIRPLTEITGYDTRWGWDKQEKDASRETRFARRLRRASDEVAHDERENDQILNFDNPAFNILTGRTNFTVSEIASDLDSKH